MKYIIRTSLILITLTLSGCFGDESDDYLNDYDTEDYYQDTTEEEREQYTSTLCNESNTGPWADIQIDSQCATACIYSEEKSNPDNAGAEAQKALDGAVEYSCNVIAGFVGSLEAKRCGACQ